MAKKRIIRIIYQLAAPTLIVTLLFLQLGAWANSAHAFSKQNNLECNLQPLKGTTGRVLVLVNGIDTSARNLEDMAAFWKQLTTRLSNIYSYVLYFSYNDNDVTSYKETDTYQSILFHHAPLLHSRIEQCLAQGHTSFDLVGYSLGGVVANEYIKAYGFKYSGRVQHVITLDSPVNGIANIYGDLTPGLQPAETRVP